MFRVEIVNKVYGVRFQYRPVALLGDHKARHFKEVSVDDKRESVGPPSIRTTCQILLLDDVARSHEIVAEGAVTCDHRDQFDKNKGRFMAFERAIKDMRNVYTDFTKPSRKMFFDTYFKNHKHKRHIIERRAKKALESVRKVNIPLS